MSILSNYASMPSMKSGSEWNLVLRTCTNSARVSPSGLPLNSEAKSRSKIMFAAAELVFNLSLSIVSSGPLSKSSELNRPYAMRLTIRGRI